MNELPKNPCRGCDYEKNKRNTGPCENCLLPGQHDDALKKILLPSYDLLKNSVTKKSGKTKDTEGYNILREPINQKPEPKKEIKDMDTIPLETYCKQEGVSVEDVQSKSKDPKISEARKNIAKAMANAEGLDYKVIAVRLKMAHSTVWNYLNTKPEKTLAKNSLTLDFSSCPEVYDNIITRADEELRDPEKQAVWILKTCDLPV